MNETIQLGDISILVTRKKVKNVHLSVHPPDGRVTLVAPTATRLIKHERIDEFHSLMEVFRDQLAAGVQILDRHFDQIKSAARVRLGSLYNESDYPVSLDEMFGVEWDFPSVDPPDYLRQLNPDLYREQSRRVSERFERTVELAEQAFTEELDRLVNHLAERLSGEDDGRPKVFRDSAIHNLSEFFVRFRELNVGSCEQLNELVADAERLLSGVQPVVPILFTPEQLDEHSHPTVRHGRLHLRRGCSSTRHRLVEHQTGLPRRTGRRWSLDR